MIQLGVSNHAHYCGLRDYAEGLAAELHELGASSECVWTSSRRGRGYVSQLWDEWKSVRLLLRGSAGADVVVLHWTPFALGTRGVPTVSLLLPILLRARRKTVYVVLHELVYPWGRHGVRGLVWALAQRAGLPVLVAGVHGAIVTTAPREKALRRMGRLTPARVACIPVWSNIPADEVWRPRGHHGLEVHSFGWGHEAVRADIAAGAVALLAGRGVAVNWTLIGGDPLGGAAASWRSAFHLAGASDTLRFTGRLSSSEIGSQLASCSVYADLDADGPSSRRGSLAAALAIGVPTITLESPGQPEWDTGTADRAFITVPPAPGALAETLYMFYEDARTGAPMASRLGDSARRYMLARRARRSAAEFVLQVVR